MSSIWKYIWKYPILSCKPDGAFLGLLKTLSYFCDTKHTNNQLQEVMYNRLLSKLEFNAQNPFSYGMDSLFGLASSPPSYIFWRPTKLYLSDLDPFCLARKQIQLWFRAGGLCVFFDSTFIHLIVTFKGGLHVPLHFFPFILIFHPLKCNFCFYQANWAPLAKVPKRWT